MKSRKRSIFTLTAVMLISMGVFTQNVTAQTLSKDDQTAYDVAHHAWKRIAKLNEQDGQPPLPVGEEPQPEDFVGAAQQQRADAAKALEQRKALEVNWQHRLNALRPVLRTPVPHDGDRLKNLRVAKALAAKAALIELAEFRQANQEATERELDRLAAQAGVPRERMLGPDRKAIFAGMAGNEPLWISSHDLVAGGSIAADQLWPQAATPWTAQTTGLDLTGNGVLLGMWEAGGAVRTTHSEFQSRVEQVDDTDPQNPISLSNHASGVAGTMAAGGFFNFPFNGVTATHLRGTAYEAAVDAHDLFLFENELTTSAAGTPGVAGLRLANNSWGLVAGWRVEDITYFDAQNNPHTLNDVWRWYGDPTPGVLEDWKHSYYTFPANDGTSSQELDAFMAQDAPMHLLVYSAGNDRFNGPGGPVDYYFVLPDINPANGRIDDSEVFFYDDPPANERDWASGDGDVGGYDSLGPPGTAKNVLTVGAVEDVFHLNGGNMVWGFGPGAQVNLAEFSGCGPTDDGRIKPDLVAVGAPNPAARAQGLITPGSAADDNAVLFTGTSFSAPAVSGGIGLAMQRRTQLYPNHDPETDDLRGSTWKCLAIHTADDLGAPGPNFQMGYGLFNARALVEQVELDAVDGRGTHIREFELEPNMTTEWLVSSQGTEPIRVTIAWSDPAGVANTTAAPDPQEAMLVNNIDLRVESEDGTQQFLPWILNPDLGNEAEAVRALPATTGTDDRNNVEQVVIAAPTVGTYRIVITHSGGLVGGPAPSDQWISVVSSGDIVPPPAITTLERSPAGTEHLIHLETGPGEYLRLESASSLDAPQVWQDVGGFTTESGADIINAANSGNALFWRFIRE
jgi:hypothetical protein